MLLNGNSGDADPVGLKKLKVESKWTKDNGQKMIAIAE